MWSRFFPSISYTNEWKINAPIDFTYSAFMNFNNRPYWMPGFKKIKLISGTDNAEGAVYMFEIRSFFSNTYFKETVKDIETNREYIFDLENEQMHAHNQIIFLISGADKTTLLSKTRLQGKTKYDQAVIKLLERNLRKKSDHSFKLFKSFVEDRYQQMVAEQIKKKKLNT